MKRLLKNFLFVFTAVIASAVLFSCSNDEAAKNLTDGKNLVSGKNWEGAIPKLTAAINEGDDVIKAQAYYQRALAKEQLRDEKGAIADYSEALKIKGEDYESWHNRGILKDNLGDHAGAVADYTAAIKLDDTRYEAYLNRGVAYSNLSKRREAAQDFEYAIRRNPKFARAWYFLALTKHNLKDTTACGDARNAAMLGLAEAGEFLKENCQ